LTNVDREHRTSGHGLGAEDLHVSVGELQQMLAVRD
jgi:hypothetical protein